ncbi:MAG: hypothetical protein M1828_004820 [Chrysothrix sp. TS-e1954]|nr:MAG: hypothetical protein M1828_004820 [Chrysothrix sp. TS-e1954]
MRRSSYASVVSGTPVAPGPNANQQPPRAGFLSQISNPSTTSDPSQQGLPPRYLQTLPSPSDPIPPRHSITSDYWEGSQLPHHSTAFGDILSMPIMEQRVPSDIVIPSYLRGSRYAERLQEKYRARNSAQRESRNGRSSGNGTLSTSNSGINLHKMVPSHRGMTHEIVERPYSRPEDKLNPVPVRWSMTDKYAGLEMHYNGLEVKFNGVNKTQDDAAAVRADAAMPQECGIYYFEVTILSKGRDSQIGVGFSAAKVALNRLPGWETESWAYHGDDGYIFCQTATGKSYANKFGYQDVIGCGINFRTGCAFYTKNGQQLGTAFKELDTSKPLFPSVGMKKPGEMIKANFGQGLFVFDIDGMVAEEKAAAQSEILLESCSHLHASNSEATHLRSLVLQYLAHDGYVETAKALSTAVHANTQLLTQTINATRTSFGSPTDAPEQLEYREDVDAINRQRIRGAVLEGDVDKALKLTNAYYPGVLRDNENVYFRLRCRKFVELILKGEEVQRSVSGKNTISKQDQDGHTKFGHDSRNGQRAMPSGSAVDDRPLTSDGASAMDVDDASMRSRSRSSSSSVSDVASTPNDNAEQMDLSLSSRQSDLFTQALQYGQDLQSEFKDDPRREVKQALEDTFALIAYPDARESSLAPLLEVGGRVGVAEELNSAILVSLGKSSNAVLERLCQESEVLLRDLDGRQGERAAFVNFRQEFSR